MHTRVRAAVWMCVAYVCACSGVTFAQTPPVLNQLVEGTCSGFVAPVLGRPDIAQLVTERSIDSRTVCTCALERAKTDPRIVQLTQNGDEQFVREAQDARVRAYVIGRVLNSVLACFSGELSVTLDVVATKR